MTQQLTLGDLVVDVAFKDIKNIHLSVHPPAGRITVAAPRRMSLDLIRVFTISKLAWIKRQRQKVRNQARETIREYKTRESHFLWGKRYLLRVVEGVSPASVTVRHDHIDLGVPRRASITTKEAVLQQWYREQVRLSAQPIMEAWASKLEVEVAGLFVQRMKTKWGTCNFRARTIRLNTELAKKPKTCFEYVVLHELVHLIEPTHNERFVVLMDRLMPDWPLRRGLLNELPLCHDTWAE
jgi:predicted metal-dependent hydrolase